MLLPYLSDINDPRFEKASEFYHQNGYLVIDPQIGESVLDGAINDNLDKFADWKPGGAYNSVRIQDAWKTSSNVKQIALNEYILTLLKKLYGRKPLPFQTLNFPVGTEQAVHSDTIHFNCEPAGLMCGVWVALENIGPNNGPLVYYPGSHHFPEYTQRELGLPAGRESYNHYEAYLQSCIKNMNLPALFGHMKKGMALVWAANLWHGGAIHQDKTKTRHSQVTHYFFSGSEYYYIPMLSEKNNIHYKNPVWIE